jgi:uncharacterized SAM-binding protein YcdF (DUF218 family)
VIYPLIGLIVVFVGVLIGIGFYLSPQNPLHKTDAIVVISGGETEARVAEASLLYREHYAPVVIFSGAAKSGTVSNALAMSRIAARQGVPVSAEVLEEKSATTAANADEVAEIVKQAGYKSIILVTSPYHQRRASIEFHRALSKSVTIINHSATDSIWRKSSWWSNNKARSLTLSESWKVLFLSIGGGTPAS